MAKLDVSNSIGEIADLLGKTDNSAKSTIEDIQTQVGQLHDPNVFGHKFDGAAISVDTVTAAGLHDLGDIKLDADGTISATSTAKSNANAANVSDDSAGLAFVDGNFGLDQAHLIEVKSNAGLSATAATTINAASSTSKGDAAAMASLQDAAGIRDLADLNVGGELTALGKAVNTITASAETVVGDTVGAQATAELFGTQQGFDASDINVSSNATVQGLSSLVNSATAAATSHGDALAEALGGDLIGANIDGIDVGGIANVTGQTTFGNTSKATNVEGDSTATSNLLNADGLISTTGLADHFNGSAPNPTASFEVSSDATIKGLTSVTAAATAETTKGDATAASTAANINGADFQGLLDIGGVGSITGSASFNLAATASSVTFDNGSGGATAIAGGADLSSQGLQGAAGANLSDTNLTNDVFGIDVASNATLSGTAIGTLKADASSTADDATARAGQSAELTGADIGSLHVGGVANLTGAAQLTSTAIAANVGDGGRDALAESGLTNTTVTGLDASFMDVASDATITAQAFGTLNATATSTGGDATAKAGQYTSGAGDSSTVLTGLETGLDLSIGGVGTLNALAQGSENASATTVDGIATASAGLDLNGAIGLDFASSSDGSLTGIAKLAATASASSTANTAAANGDFSAVGFDGLTIGNTEFNPGTDVAGIGGISTLKGQAQITGTLNAESVSGDALAGVGDLSSSIVGMHNVVLNGASDGTILGTASGVFNTNAINIGGAGFDASGFSSQSLKGIDQIDLHLGGNGGINAIVNDQNFVTAHSVSGNATSVASADAIGLNGGDMHIAGNASIMATVGVDSKSEAHTVA